jgi:ribonuclease P protein component
LRTPAQFAAVAAARGAFAARGARRWLSMNCLIARADPVGSGARTRLGLTVARRLARRAVDRNLVKRVVREALRAAAPALDDAAASCRIDAAAGARLDIVVRLKVRLPPVAQLPRVRLKPALRAEADALFAALARDVRAAAGADSAGQP